MARGEPVEYADPDRPGAPSSHTARDDLAIPAPWLHAHRPGRIGSHPVRARPVSPQRHVATTAVASKCVHARAHDLPGTRDERTDRGAAVHRGTAHRSIDLLCGDRECDARRTETVAYRARLRVRTTARVGVRGRAD